MKIVAVIPCRYDSTRLPGKPLADICGKPMIWWVYNNVRTMNIFSDIVCAIDDNRIRNVCEELAINYIMTKNNHPNHIARIHEVSESINADYYICINGDEPLISESCILPVFPKSIMHEPYFGGAMRDLTDPAETVDFAKIKIAFSESTGRCLYMSRTPVPYPRGTLLFKYKKYVGVECFNKSALDFFVSHEMGSLERAEDIDHLRFLENGVDLHFSMVDSDSISVDTPKDLEFVRMKMKKRLEENMTP